jgi:hypothetical protein
MSVQTRGKFFTTPDGVSSLLSVLVPTALDFINQAQTNGPNSVVNLMVKSDAVYNIRLKDYTTGVWTDSDTIIVSGTYSVFSISAINILDIELTPSINNQNFYVYLSGEVN